MRWFILLALVTLVALLVVQDSDGWWSRRRTSARRRSYSSVRRRSYSYSRRRSSYRRRSYYYRRRRRVVCPSITCKNSGTRYCSGSSAYCRCRTGYYGSRCQKGCGYLYCYNGGQKICRSSGWWSSKKVAKCKCPRGTRGKQCQQIICPSIKCKNGGTKKCRGRKAYCTCRAGYSGNRCQYGCGTISCYNGGYKICKSGWWGSKKAHCKCPNRWIKGKHCKRITCPRIPCYNGGTRKCLRPGAPKCFCLRGFNGKNCQNGCKPKSCYNGGTKVCVKHLVFFTKAKCRCRIGYHGHDCRHSCPKLKKPCLNGGKTHCTKHFGLFTFSHCVCPSGYKGKQCECRGSNCPSVNGCKRIKKCLNGGTKVCVKFLIFFQKAKCRCPVGYYGRLCGKQCPGYVCKNGGKTHCTNHFGLFTFPHCVCSSGYKGKHCKIPKCRPASKKCVHGRVKCLTKKKFICICNKGYTNSRCDTPICRRITCQNRGKPICNAPYRPRCRCRHNFEGSRCGCKKIRCFNGGRRQCITVKDSKTLTWTQRSVCKCPKQFTGRLCQKSSKPTQSPTTASLSSTPTQGSLLTVEQGNFTFDAEGNDVQNSKRFSRRLHVFSNSSGVTVGRGYDLKDKSPNQMKRELLEVGIQRNTVTKLKTAIGLTGDKAKKWIEDKKLGNFTITRKQQKTLFQKEYARKTKIAKSSIEKYSQNKLKFKQLSQVAKDIVIDIFYRGDYSMSNDFPKKKKISITIQKAFDESKNKTRLTALYKLLKNYEFWMSKARVDIPRAKARVCYVYKSKPAPANETLRFC